jgi:chromosome segregation ATPase
MLELEISRLQDRVEEAKARAERLSENASADLDEITALKAKVATASDQAKQATTKYEELQTSNKELNATIGQLRHQIQLMELDGKAAEKDVQMSHRESQLAIREREAETKAFERQIVALEKENELLRRGGYNMDQRPSKSSARDVPDFSAERDTLMAEITRLRNAVSTGPPEVGKLDAVAKAAQEEFEKINAARKADKEKWKAEKAQLMKRLEGVEGEVKQKQAAPAAAPVSKVSPVDIAFRKRLFVSNFVLFQPSAPARKKKQNKSSSSSESDAPEAPRERAPKKVSSLLFTTSVCSAIYDSRFILPGTET